MFAGAIRLDGGPAPMSFRAAVRGAPYCAGHALHWVTTDGLLAVVGPEHGACPPAIARSGSVTVVGVARIDNRGEILAWLGDIEPSISDLALAGRVALRRGVAGVARLLGDFAFVAWEADTRTLIAARDTFGVKQLYYATPSPGVVTFSSRAELLAQGDDYDVEYLAGWISYCGIADNRTVFRGVSTLPEASVLSIRPHRVAVTRYWAPVDAPTSAVVPRSVADQCDQFREVLLQAVQCRLATGGRTWSHLSGGLDSSSITCIAQWMTARGLIADGLGGTVSFVDARGTAADEREYSDAVVARYHVRGEAIPHQPDQSDVLIHPPAFDQPHHASYGVVARDRETVQLIKSAGGTVLLTGLGGDNLVLGTMFFFADWIAMGRLSEAVNEMAHRAALGRVSFWELAYQNAVLPLVPERFCRWLVRHDDAMVPPWITPGIARRFGLRSRSGQRPAYGAPLGRAYAHAQLAGIVTIPGSLRDGIVGDHLDLRHPFLHRPLVELALQLPAEVCVRPHARKWILREAMRGILPEVVRTRVGKGTGEGLAAWSLAHERPLVEDLLRDPLLAQLGIIDPARLRTAVSTTQRGGRREGAVSAAVLATLDCEMWLRIRTGRWVVAHAQQYTGVPAQRSTKVG